MPKKKEKEITKPVTVTVNQPEDKPIGEIVATNFKDYSSYSINHRAVPELYGGIKESYKRLIYAAHLMYKAGTLSPAESLVKSVSRWHPHSVDGLDGTMALFVHSGVFSGEGAFGGINIADGEAEPCAALRYLHISLSPVYHKILGELIDLVPKVESPTGEMEPQYIPLPLPLSCCLKSDVTGLGSVKTVIPSFKPWSLYQAYIHNDPNLLEVNCNINIDKANSTLADIWNTGTGIITYYYNVTPCKGPDGRSEGVLFEGDTWKFTPKWNNEKFKKLVEDGKIFTVDLTDITGPKLFMGKVPDVRGITATDVVNLAKELYWTSINYSLKVTSDESAKPIPLKIWVDLVYKNYINLLIQVNQIKIAECEFAIQVQKAIPIFRDYIVKVNPEATDEELQKNLGFTPEIIKALSSKSLMTIRKTPENEEALNRLNKELEKLKSFDPIKFTEDIIKQM